MCKAPGAGRRRSPIRSTESGPRRPRGTAGQSPGLGGSEEGGRAERDGEEMESPLRYLRAKGWGVSGG